MVQMGSRCPEPTPLILFSPQIDAGWIDLLEAGVFDLVVEPSCVEHAYPLQNPNSSLFMRCTSRINSRSRALLQGASHASRSSK